MEVSSGKMFRCSRDFFPSLFSCMIHLGLNPSLLWGKKEAGEGKKV